VNATRVRDWARVDFYAVLGVDPAATADEITAAYRSRAKRLHPDAAGGDAAAQFHDLSAAYGVLSDARTRRDYDRVRLTASAPATVPPSVGSAVPARPRRWTRRRAQVALWAGVSVTLLGVVALYFTWYLHDRDADRRAAFVPVTAQRIGDDQIEFVTRDGRRVQTSEPRQRGEASSQGPTVGVRYDPNDPARVVVDAGSFGRDITLFIVALKCLVAGPAFVVVGARRLSRA
jgi:curved DNA-binding protein CbpA